jgi:hypothetical protein
MQGKEHIIKCERKYLKCKGYAEGQIGWKLICRRCLELGEGKDFKPFEK